MLFLKQPLILHFLCHKSATACQIDSKKVSNSKLRLDLSNFVKTEIIEYTAPPQKPHKRSTIFMGNPVQNYISNRAKDVSLTCFGPVPCS